MSQDIHKEHNVRLAKNTLMLYVRMVFLMVIGLYTSRVVLQSLGEEDFGIYNVVGGLVSMFSLISASLSSSISRFITYELGSREESRLTSVFSSAVLIQIILACVVVAVAEPLGLWFIGHKMNIPIERIGIAKWVFQFSLLTFVVNLISIPYNALIIAHEKMAAFAYIGIFEGLGKLAVAFMIVKSSGDRLILYAVLMSVVAIAVRFAYSLYCRKHFPLCRLKGKGEKGLLKQMFSFAGWNFIGITSVILRDHGSNILVNIFSGPVANAARGVALQLNGAVQNFVTNFMTAINPQITKSYASEDLQHTFSLVRKGARFSYYLLLVLALPVLFNMESLMGIWLKEVPEGAASFASLFLIFAMSESLSMPLITAINANGNIRNTQIIVGGIQLLNIPVSYIFLKAGYPPQIIVVVAIVLSQICFFARLFLLSGLMGFPVRDFLSRVYLNVLVVTSVAVAVSDIVDGYIPEGLTGTLISFVATFMFAVMSVAFIGCRKQELKEAFVGLKRILHG